MKKELLPFQETGAFSSFFLDYVSQKPQLKNFYSRFPEIKNFGEQIKEKEASFSIEKRQVLKKVLQEQYASIEPSDIVKKNIDAIEDQKTFTVVTGHQLNLFTGPLFFIFKIITTINTCKQLSTQYPGYRFVPVYWMASEDHDFEEIACFKLLGKKYCWKTSQKGAVGKMTLEELLPLLKEIPGQIEPFASAYLSSANLSEAVRKYVNSLFGEEGLIVLDADHRALKKEFSSVMKNDLLKGMTEKLARQTNDDLKNAGYEPQVLIRPVNLFYLDQGIRERIERDGDHFKVLETGLKFSESAITQILAETPEKFSPNVILRPLYQETILPNLAYIGGPAELVYWLQLKNIFDHFNTPFPILFPRNFGMIADEPAVRLLKKTGISLQELFLDKDSLLNLMATRNSSVSLSLENFRSEMDQLLGRIKNQATSVDASLTKMVDAELHRMKQGAERIQHKMLRAEKRKGSDLLRQAEKIKDQLFPGGAIQERTDNLLNFYQTDRNFIAKLSSVFNPFDFRFHVLLYE